MSTNTITFPSSYVADRINAIRENRIEEGREIAKALIPDDCKALIVAEFRRDQSDSQTDYFGSVVEERIVLATSTHTRDLFGEMRKAALKAVGVPELMDLALTGIDHREKYSLGGGYYLASDRGRHSTGWTIRKEPKFSGWMNSTLESLAVRHFL